jgi:magnesium transporter
VAAREGIVGAGAGTAGVSAEPSAPAPVRREVTARTRSFYRSEDGQYARDLSPRELAAIVKSGTGALWIDIDSTVPHQLAILEKIFQFHPLAIEDTLNPNSRVKLEEYDGFLFMVVRGVKFREDTDDPYDLDTFNLNFFLGKNYLVTVHTETSTSLDVIAERLTRNPDGLNRGVAWLMHGIMDTAIDAYFPLIDQIDEFIDGLEERVFVNFDESALRDIFSVKRLVLSLRRHLSPQREVFNILTNRPSTLLSHEAQLYFRDIYDHVLRINDALETYRELLSSTLDSYLTQVSNRLGKATKGLSLLGAISIPFVVVSGMWGMNFVRIPIAAHPYGFWIMLFVQLAIGGALLAMLRWRKLL